MARILLLFFLCQSIWAATKPSNRFLALEKVALETLIEANSHFELSSEQKSSLKHISHGDITSLKNMASNQGMFISIFNSKNRKLLGCMGSLYPVRGNLFDEVKHWALMAAWADPRFVSRRQKRKTSIAIIVTLIDKTEPVNSYLQVNAIRYGLLVKSLGREALVLPGEAYTAAYALKMIGKKLAIPEIDLANSSLHIIHARRFGYAKKLFQKQKNFRGYGG